jgi:chemotaxis protein methyltransferase CheR
VKASQPVASSLTSDPLFASLKAYLIEASGMNYYADKDEDLANRILRRLAVVCLDDCASYLGLLRDPIKGRAELDELIAEVTIGETYFFRHSEHFDALRDIVIPDVLARNQDKRTLRIWCAGCADGPEAYSLAILLGRQMEQKLADWSVSILATDINRHSLARACEGKYGEWAFRSTTEDLRRECFTREGPLWRIAPRYRRWISFEHYNLVTDPVSAPVTRLLPLDLVVCRNVMIYFDAEISSQMIQRFHGCLAEGGWLLVGPTEPNMKHFKAFSTVNAPGVTLYQKSPPESTPAPNPTVNRVLPSLPAPPPPAYQIPPRPKPARVEQIAPPTLTQARHLADRGDWAGAMEICGLLLKQDSLDWRTQFYHALVLDHMGRREEAEAGLRKAVYLERQSAVPHYYLGLLLQSKGNTRQAARFFENAIELLEARMESESIAEADGITVAEMKKLAKMHLQVLQPV